jgi:integrase/recombinase XerD
MTLKGTPDCNRCIAVASRLDSRHTTAIHLLKSGIDFGTISQVLGHSGIQTTMRYARADLDLKRQALAQVFPDVLGAPKSGRMALHGTELTRWLRHL